MNTFETTNRYIAQSYGRLPVSFARGKGSLLYDEDGKEYVDLGTGIAVNIFGASDDVWLKAVCDQAATLQHCSNYYYHKPQAELAKLLCTKGGMENLFFCNSGAEANECAIKVARKYSSDKYGPGRHGIVTLVNSFHGRTMASLSATGQDALHKDFWPFLEGFTHVPANDLSAMEEALGKEGVCAVMMEIIQGEGGMTVLEKEYVQAVARICAEKDILLVMDEVQCGNGRTGKYFAFMHYGVQPDIVSTAKSIAGGLPMGATLFGKKTCGVLTPGTHGSTYGGNPVCAAAGVSIISRIDQALMDEVARKGEYAKSRLTGAPGVEAVTGLGLMIGVKTTKEIKAVLAECREKGLIVLNAKDRVRMLPALNIPMDILAKGIDIFMEVISQ